MSEPRAGRPPGAARFEDQGEIARGGMGSVHAIWDHLLERRAALKELWNEGDAQAAAQFVEEARIMGGLDHPNILPVYDLQVDESGGSPRLLMKLVEGRTLSDLLHESPRPPAGIRLERLLGAVVKVCDAVSFAHSRGVIHRDLHPRNVMVGSHGQVYLMDWGLAIRRDEARARRGSAPVLAFGSGTPAYMAPEQAWGRDDEIDERTDVFGIGALLYEMMTLRPPFAGAELNDVLEAARRCVVVAPDVVAAESGPPARLCEIVMRALAADRQERHQTVDALRDDLESFLRSGGWFVARRFPRGAVMLREDDEGDGAYIVSQGTCEVYRTVGDRTERLRVVGPGGVVGEIGLITGARRVASVRALTDVTALVVTPAALERELGRASWMRAFVEAAVVRFIELDDVRRRDPSAS
jgi:eukaryotic-like serine/threonine-protein kinase